MLVACSIVKINMKYDKIKITYETFFISLSLYTYSCMSTIQSFKKPALQLAL